jgi:hypothetical protein
MIKKMERKDNRKTEQALVDERGPYWRRAYRDWRVLMAAFLAVVFLVTYLMTGDFNWRPKGPWDRTTETKDKLGTDLPPVTADPQVIQPKSPANQKGEK